jgi:serine/threonine-protein kinase
MAEKSNINHSTKSSTMEDAWLGKLIEGKYRIVEKLGAGGAGAVYRGEHTLMERTVAIKVLHAHLAEAETDEFLKRFQREAHVASKLLHANVVTLFDYGIEDGAPFLVMQYVEGRTLKDIINTEGQPLPVDRICRLMKQITDAMAEAHSLGVIHRDLKPDNIMIQQKPDGSEHVWILDFGIAKPSSTEEDVSLTLTRVGTFVGTPQYMSPEQALSKELKASSDIYSLGIILYEMLSGQVPFQTTSPMELLVQHISATPPPLRVVRPEIYLKSGISDVVMKALSKEPTARHQTARELYQDLHSAVEKVKQSKDNSAARIKLNKNLGIGLGALAIIGALVFAFSGSSDTNQEDAGVIALNKAADKITKDATEKAESIAAANIAKIAELEKTIADTTAAATNATSDVVKAAEGATATIANPEIQNIAATEQAPADNPLATTLADANLISPEQVATQEVPELEADTASTEELAAQTSNENEQEVEALLEHPETGLIQEPLPEGMSPLLAMLSRGITPIKADNKTADNKLNELNKEGRALFEKDDFEGAGLKFAEALRYRNNNLIAQVSLGAALLRLGHFEYAKAELAKALKIDKNYAPTHYHLAAAYAKNNEPELALKSLQTAISLFPKIKSRIAEDEDFASLREYPKFIEITAKK